MNYNNSKAQQIPASYKQQQNSKDSSNIVNYGCMISLLLDDSKVEAVTILNYDSDKERRKMNEIKKRCEEITLSKKISKQNMKPTSERLETDEVMPPNCDSRNFESSKNLQSGDSIKFKRVSRKENTITQKVLRLDDKYTENKFLFSKGVFSDNFILNNFSNIQNFQINYVDSLFRIIPAVEYESKEKLEKWFYLLNKSTYLQDNFQLDYRELKEIFMKYKQEILTNHENLIKTVSKKLPVNFDDSIQLLHVQTGKFLRFFLNKDDMKIYLKLSSNPNRNTIFRIRPGFAYQTEYSTNIYFNFGVQISCGDLTSHKEMFIGNPIQISEDEKLTKNQQNPIMQTGEELKTKWEAAKKNISIDTLINYTENLAIVSNKSAKKRWKLIKYSDNFENDNKYLNNFDMFWIYNCEKDVYLFTTQEDASLETTKFFTKTFTSGGDRDKTKASKLDTEPVDKFWDLEDRSNIRRKSKSKTNTEILNDKVSSNLLNNLFIKKSKIDIMANMSEDRGNQYLKYMDKEEKLPLEDIFGGKDLSNPFKESNKHNDSLDCDIKQNQRQPVLDQIIAESVNLFSFNNLSSEFLNKLTINVKYLQINDNNNPLGLFKFEPILMKANEAKVNEFHKEFTYSIDMYPDIGPQIKKGLVLMRNVFSNSLLSIDNNSLGLKLIIQNDKTNLEDCVFQIEQVYEKTEKENEDFAYNIKSKDSKYDKYFKKTDMIRIKSKKYKNYIAVKNYGKDAFGLVVTKNLSDLTIFKLDFINLDDKILVNFSNQLNCVIDYMLSYFLVKKEAKIFEEKDFINSLKLEIEENIQFIKLKDVFIELKEKLKNYKISKAKKENKELTKIDLMKNLKEFKIIEKIVKLMIAIWFGKKLLYENRFERENEILKDNIISLKIPNYKDKKSKSKNNINLFRNEEYNAEEKFNNENDNELNKINELDKINENLQLKIDCTILIIKILKICYDLDNTIILYIESYLPYFFKFVGKIHECTKFLIYILKNNNSQLIKLITANNPTRINEMKWSLSSYIKSGKLNNSESFSLLYELMNTMLICNDEPFKPFYKVILSDLNLFNEYVDGKFDETFSKPNLENCFLIDFEFVDNKIYFLKKYDVIKNQEEDDQLNLNPNTYMERKFSEQLGHRNDIEVYDEDIDIKIMDENFLKNDGEFRLKQCENLGDKLSKNKKSQKILSFNLNLEDYDDFSTGIDKDTIKKLITLNLNFYSNLSLHDEKFRNHLLKIFTMETIDKYLRENSDDHSFYLPEEIKCTLIKVINYLYLKEKEEKLQNIYLCRRINNNNNQNKSPIKSYWKSSSKILIDLEIKNIVNLIEAKLRDHLLGKKILSHDILLQVIESCQYIIRNFYHYQNKADSMSIKEVIFKLMSSLVSILENSIGINSAKMSKRSTYYECDELTILDRDAKEKLLHELKNEKINLDSLNLNWNDEVVSNLNRNSPYVRLYEENRSKFLDVLTSPEKMNQKITDKSMRQTRTINFGFIEKMISTDNYDPNITTIRNYTRANKTSSKESKHEIMKRICVIFTEFLKYIENSYILKIEDNVINLVENFDSDNLTREYIDSMQIITKNVYNFSDANELEFMNLLDEFALYHKSNKLKMNLMEDRYRQELYLVNDAVNKKILPKQEEYLIINIFFECLKRLNSMDLKLIIFEIIYRVNSQRMILFENVSNMVILSEKHEVEVFDDLKQTLTNLNVAMMNLNSTYEKDDSALLFIGKFKKHLRKAIQIICTSETSNNSYDANTMRNQIKQNLFDTNYATKEDNKQVEIELAVIGRDSFNTSKKNGFEFMKDVAISTISNMQYILKNLDVHIIIFNFMKKANEIMERIIKSDISKGINKELFEEIQIVIAVLYELLALFIKDNKKHKFIMEEAIETILFVIFIKNYLNEDVMTSLSSFLLEFIKNFKLSDLNSIDKLIDMMHVLVKNMDWVKDREIIPNWVEIMRVIIKTPQIEYDDRLVFCFDRFRRFLVHELVYGKISKIELRSLTDLLKLLMEMRNSTNDDYENNTKFILPLKEIVSIWDTLKNDEEEVSFEVLNIAVDYLYMNIMNCKTELANNKQFLRKLEINLLNFISHNDRKIMYKIFLRGIKNDEENFLQLNLFIGISIPKLSFIIKQISFVENIRQTIIDAISKALNLTEMLVNHIKDKIEALVEVNEQSEYLSKTFLNEMSEGDMNKLFCECNNIKPLTIILFCQCKILITENLLKLKEDEKRKELEEKDLYVKKIKSMSIKILRKKTKKGRNTNNKKTQIAIPEKIQKVKTRVHSYTKTSIWNFIREILNNPYIVVNDSEYSDLNSNFYQKLNSYINKERQNLIENIFFYYAPRLSSKSTQNNITDEKNFDIAEYQANSLEQIFEFIKIINDIFLVYIDRNTKIKEKLYFYYWILIHFMNYDAEKKVFSDQPSMRNKFVFKEMNFLTLISNILRKKNLKCIDYTIAVIIKYFTTYLHGLDDNIKILFNDFLIKNVESENIFLIMKNILENLKSKLSKIGNNTEQLDEFILNYTQMQKEWKTVNFDLAKYENYINPFEEIVQMISYLLENRQKTNNLIKDYLRHQSNCTKSSNFISLMESIVECFIINGEKAAKDKIQSRSNIVQLPHENDTPREDYTMLNPLQGGLDASIKIKGNLIQLYYPTLIKIIESLSKCCQGPSLENQNFLLNDTKILDFISVILFKVSYRPNIVNKDMIDCRSLNISRKKLSYLKYKILIFVLGLVEGRKKHDKIFETVVDYIDYVSLSNIMIETIQEVMVEKNIDNFDDLVMDEDLFQRFENIKFDATESTDDRQFIIFEIGTYVYILMNNFYDNWHEVETDNGNIKSIKEMRKILSSMLQQTNRENTISTTYEFFKKLFFSLKDLCNLFLRKKKIFTDVHCESLILQDNYYFKCYEFYFKYTPRIEIIFNNDIISYYVKLFPMCQYLKREMKDDFHVNVDRSNTITKLNYLFKRLYYFRDALVYSQKLEELYKKIPLMDLILNQYTFFEDLSLLITFVINFVIIASYCQSSDGTSYVYAFLYNMNNLNITMIILRSLGILQFSLSALIFINYIIRNIPKYTYLDSDKNAEKPSLLRKSFTFLIRLFQDFYFFYHCAYFLFALFAYYTEVFLLFSFHLLETARRSSTIINILLAIYVPGRQLIVTIFLFVLFEYFFIIFIYLYFYNQLNTMDCYRFDQCFFTIIDQTFKNSNGMINFLNSEMYQNEYFLGKRFWLDNLFAIVLIMIIVQMIAGIIIDNFSALREDMQKIEEDKCNVCFICGLTKNELNKLYGNEEGYEEHVKLDHYYWNYMFLIFNLLRKDKYNLNGLDLYIYKCYENKNYSWIPQEICKQKLAQNKLLELGEEKKLDNEDD